METYMKIMSALNILNLLAWFVIFECGTPFALMISSCLIPLLLVAMGIEFDFDKNNDKRP